MKKDNDENTGRLSFPFEVKNCETKQDSDGENFTFEGYASTFGNVDQGDDIVARGAFRESLEQAKLDNHQFPVLFNHNANEPLGVFTSMVEDEKGLFAKASLPLSDWFVANKYKPQVEKGSIKGLSIGFRVKQRSFREGVRILEKVQLVETSLTPFPMNVLAEVTNFKASSFGFGDIEDLQLKEIEAMLRTTPCSRSTAKYLAPFLQSKQREAVGSITPREADISESVKANLENLVALLKAS